MIERIREICGTGPVIPVIEIDDAANAKPLADALLRGGIQVIEITLRTTDALKAIEVIANETNMCVGAGTILTLRDLTNARNAGAAFGVSPGSTPALLDACVETEMPFLPGAVTPSEVMGLLDRGIRVQKFFPAQAAGGIAMLKSLGGPFKEAVFCPTGGVTPQNAADYLALPNVICVGGSWVASRKLIAENAWEEIEKNAREVSALA
ncbi:MAG: bifunctional 4-hydroxy-2-oxoglutarate aldolase/2-dehydro-3-deoxy-phosphogluconate aldolase [Pseudomonadota bacterium]